jgi:predicted ATPase
VAQIGAVIGREFSHTLIAAVARKAEPELRSALDRVIGAGLLFRQGVAPHATYLFKHALVQDAACGTLLREPRRKLHARIAETLENQFAEISENRPEVLARHCTEAGLIEKAAALWGKAGLRSLERSALIEALAQFTRALDQITTLPETPALRRKQIKLQIALIHALMHVKGYAASETKAAIERARLLIEQAEALGEPPEDPMELFIVLATAWSANYIAFNGELIRELAAQFLALAEKQTTTGPLTIGHHLMGMSLMLTGDIAQGRVHLDRAIALYDPATTDHARRFGVDTRVSALCYRTIALWMLGYPDAALTDAAQALENARKIGHAAVLMHALAHTPRMYVRFGNFAAASDQVNELITVAHEKNALFWKAAGIVLKGELFVLTGKAADAVEMITSGIAASRQCGATAGMPLSLSILARAYGELGQLDDAWRCIGEAITAVETTKATIWETQVYRTAGELSLMSPKPDAAKAETYFQHSLAVARQQQAKSWELRASMSLARLWRDQGKLQQARELLAPIYGWFTEGFDTSDLKEAKVLLEELAA